MEEERVKASVIMVVKVELGRKLPLRSLIRAGETIWRVRGESDLMDSWVEMERMYELFRISVKIQVENDYFSESEICLYPILRFAHIHQYSTWSSQVFAYR